MEYLNHVLGIQVIPYPDATMIMPNYIDARYRLQKVSLSGKKAIFVYPWDEIESVSTIKKHIEKITEKEKVPAILVLEQLTHRQREYLIRDRIPFIVDGKQIYLPFMAVYLQERGNREKLEIAEMLPSAQLLLLLFIYHGCGELLTSKAAEVLRLTPTSISRASRQLEELGFIKTEKQGVQKAIISEKTPKELFLAARDKMPNPVKRTLYTQKSQMPEMLPLASYSALAEYSMMNPTATEYRAAKSIAAWEKNSSARLQDPEDECAVQLWRYDPSVLAANGCVDRLSLALSLQNDLDERVEEAIEQMLEQLWEEIDGKGN